MATPTAGAGIEDAQQPDRTAHEQQDQTRQHPSDGSKQPGYRQEEEGHGEPCLTVPETPPPRGGWQRVGHVRDPTGEGCLNYHERARDPLGRPVARFNCRLVDLVGSPTGTS
jgi:hypothetical protein